MADINADGHQDIVLVKGRRWPLENLVRFGDGTGSFGAATLACSWSNIDVADLDLDGRPDVIMANRWSQGGPSYVCLGLRNGRFRACTAFAEGSATTISHEDFNHDGAPDLMGPHRDGGQSFIYLNDGAGGFANRRPFGDADGSAYGFAVRDIDEDGFLDIAMARSDAVNMLYFGAAPQAKKVASMR